MRLILSLVGLLSLSGCVQSGTEASAPSPPARPPAGLAPQGPMPTGQIPYGTLSPAPSLGHYWVEGQATGTVRAR